MEETIVQTQESAQQTAAPSPFGQDAWTETLPQASTTDATQTVEEKPVTTDAAQPAVTTTNEEVIDQKEWLKREFEIEDVEILKAERAEYKKLKETPPTPAEIKFADEQSKHIHELIRDGKKKEVREFLETQERLETYSSLEVSNDNAEDIIKLGMKIKNPSLSQKEIDFLYKEDYIAGKEPVQKATEDDDDFKERHDEWQEKAGRLEMKRTVAAKLAQPDLQKAKSELTLPELTKKEQIAQANEPTQESLDAIKKVRDHFLHKLESDFSKVDGFSTKVKDESVEIPISFKIPDEDKVAIKARLQEGFDVNEFIDKRWFPEGNPNIEQIISDIFQLENPDKILSGVANNAANQRLVQYRKSIGNINVNGTSQQTFDQQQNGQQSVSPFSQGAWSEKPPQFTN